VRSRTRKLRLLRERLFYNSIHGRLWRRINFAPFQAMLEQPHRLFSGKDFREQIKIAVIHDAVDAVEKVINDEATLDQWLNVHEYHRDDGAKEAQLDRVTTLVTIEDLQGIFVSMMVDKAKAIMTLGSIIRALRDRDAIARTFSVAPADPTS
jgi:hypothetical protein